jgi:hypothetical protein
LQAFRLIRLKAEPLVGQPFTIAPYRKASTLRSRIEILAHRVESCQSRPAGEIPQLSFVFHHVAALGETRQLVAARLKT